jgi:N-acetylneuraminic acid mutarotase
VSKTTYSDLYKVIGDTFAPPGPGAGVPWQSQCSFNSSTQSDITNWASANSLATATSQAASLVTKNYIYVLGGAGNNEILSTIQKASFDNDGKLTSGWNNVSSLPAAMYGMGYVTTKGRFYLIGGNNRSSVYSVPINTDGTLGDFRTETSLSAARESPICFVIKDKLYVVGGSDKNTVYRAIVNNDGTLSSWETLPNFPVNVINGKPLLIKNRIYIFSALYSNAPYYYYTTYDSDGNIGSWTDFSGIPNGIYESVIVCTDNYVFSIGGYDRANDRYTASAYRAPISADGSIGTWVQISDGPTAVTDAQVAIAGNKIYFIGGYNGNGGRSSVVYSATFNSGITDYAQYYTDQQNTSSTFNLPDYSSKEITSSGTCYYIKT